MPANYPKQPAWKLMLHDIDVDVDEVLRLAGLSKEWLGNQSECCSQSEFIRFWGELEKTAGDRNLALLLANKFTAESTEYPISGALYQKNFRSALNYLRRVYPLISPLALTLDKLGTTTTVSMKYIPSVYEYDLELTDFYQTYNLMLLVQVLRIGTRSNAYPHSIVIRNMPEHFISATQSFCGAEIRIGKKLSISFTDDLLDLPFLTYNPQFEGLFNGFCESLNASLKLTSNE